MPHIATQVTAVDSSELEQDLKELDAGVLKDLAAKGPLLINGTSMTPAQIDAQLKAYIGTIEGTAAAKQQYLASLVTRRNEQVEARNFYLQVKRAVVACFGPQAAELADFGLTPAKAVTPKTAAEHAITEAKKQLTRKARGTMSKKQKAAINPGVGTPAAVIGPDGTLQAIAPTVVNGALPGTAAGSSSTPANGAPAPGATGSTVTAGK